MRRATARLITAFICFMIGAASLVSQTPTATGQASPQSGMESVSLDLAVRDRHNKPILTLQPQEISITDNGTSAKLTGLRLVDGKQENEPLITLLFDRPGMQDREKKSTDLLFGQSASAAKDTSRRLREAAAKFLKKLPASGFEFGVVDTWGRLQVQQEYTTDRKRIMEAVSAAVTPETYGSKVTANAIELHLVEAAKAGQDSSGAVVSTRERALARSMYTALQTSSHITKDQHLSLSHACLLALVEAQQSLPGRKAVVYFSAGSDASGDFDGNSSRDSHAKDAVRSIIGAANRAGVNIYVVLPGEPGDDDTLATLLNMAGMATTGNMNTEMTPIGPGAGLADTQMYAMAAAIGPKRPTAASADDDLNELAKQTAGDVINAGGTMSGSVKDLVRSLTNYYEVSFVPHSYVEDGSFHATVFKTSRKGLRMRAQTGYLALPPSTGITDPPQPFELPLMALLRGPNLPSDLDYRAEVLHMGHQIEGSVGLMALEVPVSGLKVHTDASTRLSSAHVSVLAAIADSTGTEIERFSEDIARRWSSESGAGAAPTFISFERGFAAPPGTYVLETAILDNNSGKAAAKRQPFEISASGSVPEMSDLMVVGGIRPADAESSEPDLLWGDGRRVLPNLYGELPAGAHNVPVFFLARTDPKSQAPATVKLEVLRDGTPLKGKPLTSTLTAGNEFAPVLNSFSITSAADGKYEVQVTLTQGEKSAEKTGEFVLIGEGENTTSADTGRSGDAPIAVDPPGLEPAEQAAGRPTQEELDRILADARKNALDYGEALPNLICQETTERYDGNGNGDWKLKDAFVEALTYLNHEETRTTVGGKNAGERSNIGISMRSSGEFGVALTNIFRPESKARFTWEETGTLRGEPVEIFDYRVEQEHSPLS
jgi:VWFA-related protein